MYAEITRNIFNMIVTIDTKANMSFKDVNTLHTYYIVDDVQLMKVENFLSSTIQYYIQDINS